MSYYLKLLDTKSPRIQNGFYIQFQAVEARIQSYRKPLHQRTLHYEEILGGSYINRLHLTLSGPAFSVVRQARGGLRGPDAKNRG